MTLTPTRLLELLDGLRMRCACCQAGTCFYCDTATALWEFIGRPATPEERKIFEDDANLRAFTQRYLAPAFDHARAQRVEGVMQKHWPGGPWHLREFTIDEAFTRRTGFKVVRDVDKEKPDAHNANVARNDSRSNHVDHRLPGSPGDPS